MHKVLWFAAAVIVGGLLFPAEVVACCTAVACPRCYIAGSECPNCMLCPSSNPVCPDCNIFGCNCNEPCQCYTQGPLDMCIATACCSDAEAARTAARTRFDEIDKNRDSKISLREARAWLDKTVGKKWPQMVVREDGKVRDKQEFTRQFDRMDANHDGVITPREFDRSLQ